MIRAVRSVIVLGLSLAMVSGPAAALPMAPEDCDRARSEQLRLESAGVTTDMTRGAEWARANLEPERLKRVARWIELQEHILFRCPRPKPPPQAESASTSQPDGNGATEPIKKPQKPKATQKPQSAIIESRTGDGAAALAEPAKVKPTQQKKPRTEDAYRPPTPFSGDELQHTVPGSTVPVPASPGPVP